MKFKRNVPAFVLALVLVFTLFAYVGVSNDNSELEAEVSRLNEAVDAAQQAADGWQEKYVALEEEREQLQIANDSLLDNVAFWREQYRKVTGVSIPQLPLDDSTQTDAGTDSDVSPVTVYITNTGEKYHRWGCQYLWNSSIAVTLNYALASGYTPCSRCNPPRG